MAIRHLIFVVSKKAFKLYNNYSFMRYLKRDKEQKLCKLAYF